VLIRNQRKILLQSLPPPCNNNSSSLKSNNSQKVVVNQENWKSRVHLVRPRTPMNQKREALQHLVRALKVIKRTMMKFTKK